MNKIITIIAFAFALSLRAFGQDAPLQDYTGKYNFPEGSPVTQVELKLVDSVLIGESQMGPVTFKRIEADIFAIIEHNGVAEFKRNADGKVVAVKVTVDTLIMEGSKESAKFKYLKWLPVSPVRMLQ